MGDESFDFTADQGLDGPQAGPSWQRSNWPLVGAEFEDDLTQGLDPSALKLAIEKSAAKGGGEAKKVDQASLDQAAADALRAMNLIRTYRVRGHLAADLDPLGLARAKLPADLTPEYHGFTGAALDRPVFVGGNLGLEWTTVRELVQILRANYCGKVGLEYMHISDVEERRFLQERFEGPDKEIEFTPKARRRSFRPWCAVSSTRSSSARSMSAPSASALMAASR